MPCPDGRDCLLGWWCCCGEWPVRHPGIKSGAASAEGRVRGKPPESSPGQAPSCIGAQVLPPTGVEEKTCATRVGLGEEGWKPAGERAEEATPPVRGAA